MASCPITFLWLWPVTDHEPHSWHVPTDNIWSRTETTPQSTWWHSHMAGINSDHSTHEKISLSCYYARWQHKLTCTDKNTIQTQKFSLLLFPCLNPTRTTLQCYNNTTLGNHPYAQRKGPNVTNPICWTYKNCLHKCAADCEHCVTQSSTEQFW